jgi:hypothetical protein
MNRKHIRRKGGKIWKRNETVDIDKDRENYKKINGRDEGTEQETGRRKMMEKEEERK